MRSAWPLDWGWNPEDRLTVAPIWLQNSDQKCEVNCGPRSETTSLGRPCSRNTWCNITSAVSLAVGSLGSGMSWAVLENRSITVRMTVLLSEGGRPVTKSNEMWDQGRRGTGRRQSRPEGAWCVLLCWQQTWQAAMNSLVSSPMVPTRSVAGSRAKVRLTPGWHARREEWPHWRTCDRRLAGTNNRLSGQALGAGCLAWERFTWSSTSQVTAPMTQDGGRIPSGWAGDSSGWNWRERASGLMFFEPGL